MPHPLLHEINTRCWLRRLSDEHGRRVTLGDVPESNLVEWRELGFTHVWLMGVWTTGPRARELARTHPDLRRRYDEILPDWTPEDIPGSPYAIADYRVPDELGGESSLAEFRKLLHAHGLKLILDFVPNHMGIDHPWTREHPERFVQGAATTEGTFKVETKNGTVRLAHGRDPYFPPWSDTVQIEIRRPETREAMIRLLESVADRCDGVRCDMAILLLNGVFESTWKDFPCDEPAPREEFWAEAITAIRRAHPDFLFLAESYWNLEARLQLLGFDYTYDKALTDLLLERKPALLRKHLESLGPDTLERCAHFLENHDEQRVASQLELPEHRAAGLLLLALPGLRLIYDGQLSGAKIHAPVQMGRLPEEPEDRAVADMYHKLFSALKRTAIGSGAAMLPQVEGWEDNSTAENIVAILWREESRKDQFDLVVVNLAAHSSQGLVQLEFSWIGKHDWMFRDLLSDDRHKRSGNRIQQEGLFLDLEPHAAQLFHFTALNRRPD